MSEEPPSLYQVLPPSRSMAQINMDALVLALWYRLFPGLDTGPNHILEYIFAGMSWCPEHAIWQLCPYYFDQVTDHLPERDQGIHQESCNLRLHCFDSWTDEEQERQRAADKERRRPIRTHSAASPITGIYLSRLYQLQDPATVGSISTQEYVHRMYGYCC